MAIEQQDELNRQVADLRLFEREYRYRLTAWLTTQLETLIERDPDGKYPRQAMIGPDWALLVPGYEVRVVGVEPPAANGLQRKAIVEVRAVPAT